MMHFTPKTKTLLTLFTTSVLVTGCGGGGSSSSPDVVVEPLPPTQNKSCAGFGQPSDTQCLTVGDRESLAYQPDDQGTPDGVALFLHGAPGQPTKVMEIFGARNIAATYNLVALAPEGIDTQWGWDSINTANNGMNDDVQYLLDLVEKARTEYGIQSSQLYLFGYSAGGFMNYKLACQIPEQITAVVSLAGQHRGSLEACSTTTPVAIHHFHSPADTDVPVVGRTQGDIVSVDETLALWRDKNGCSDNVIEREDAGVTANSSGTVTIESQGCLKPVTYSSMNNVAHEDNYLADELSKIFAPVFSL